MLGMSVIRAVCKTISLPSVRLQPVHTAPVLRAAEQQIRSSQVFDSSVLQFLVCPLSRKALRYDESTNELVNDDLGIAYPILDGIPNLIPQDARMIPKDQKPKESDQKSE
ncbi:PREDICTED: protein preY, mitochondrial [Nanorana parkeri]|uniref:protein preY, mitochondrial n=1 Tax=Nanorana parkeri TaxID=125878 RepID=UPI0008540ADD|nr:PREDICTED: protein preY, mitochondrial [Nanorana parkeri]